MSGSTLPPGAPWTSLFVPAGERLGWVFLDRNRARRSFEDPPPDLGAGPPERTAQEQAAVAAFGRRLLVVWKIALGGALVGLVARAQVLLHAHRPLALADVFGVAVACGLGVGLVWAGWAYAMLRMVRSRWNRKRERHHSAELAAQETWQAAAEAHESAETGRLSAVSDWQPAYVEPGCRRVDVVGGTLWGWEALLTVFATSTLASRGPVTVLDLTGERISGELVGGAREAGVTADVLELPEQLAEADLLNGMEPQEVTESFIEALYGGLEAGADRAGRALDARILAALCRHLAPGGLTMARIAAGVRVLMGEPAGAEGDLSIEERSFLADELFSADYRARALPQLQRIEALAHALAPLGARTTPRPAAALRVLSLGSAWRSATGDFLADVLVAWAAHAITHRPETVSTLVIAGADELAARHLERLTDLADRRGVRVVSMFRHLRENTAHLLGAGPVAFMRLGNHQEAERAADYIGREHTFTVSQLTHAVGGEQTHSSADTDGGAEGQGTSNSRERGESWQGWIGQRGKHQGTTHATTSTSERTWSRTVQIAAGENWADTTTRQRVFEHPVQPRSLQQLPDYALVLVEHRPGGTTVRTVEVNPEIAQLTNPATGPANPGIDPGMISVTQYRSAANQAGAGPELENTAQTPLPGYTRPPVDGAHQQGQAWR
jgi:hypothetical protein